jgi:hypothetical protein
MAFLSTSKWAFCHHLNSSSQNSAGIPPLSIFADLRLILLEYRPKLCRIALKCSSNIARKNRRITLKCPLNIARKNRQIMLKCSSNIARKNRRITLKCSLNIARKNRQITLNLASKIVRNQT